MALCPLLASTEPRFWCWLPCGGTQWKDAQVLETLRFCRLRHGTNFRVGGSRTKVGNWAWHISAVVEEEKLRWFRTAAGWRATHCAAFPLACVLLLSDDGGCPEPFQVLCRARCSFSLHRGRLGGILGREACNMEKSMSTSALPSCISILQGAQLGSVWCPVDGHMGSYWLWWVLW